MGYMKINIELVAFSDEADAVVSKLTSALDSIEESYALFGGAIETVPVDHSGTHRRSALRHTLEGGNTAIDAVKSATRKVVDAYKKVI